MYNKYEFSDPFSVSFNVMKLKYTELDEALTSSNFLTQTDKVNVFISLEAVYKNLSNIQDLEQKIMLYKDFKTLIISNILNLAAHYKHFFVANNMDVRVYLYQTDMSSDDFKQRRYIEDFRTYYLIKYNQNPKFSYFTDMLKDHILEELKIYCTFIPRVYFINSRNIEGSSIPYVIASDDPKRKNIVIGNDVFESQYSFMDNFMYFFIQKGFGKKFIYKTTTDYLSSIFKRPKEEIDASYSVFNNFGIYAGLLSVMGNRVRSIDNISGVGPQRLAANLDEMLHKHIINPETTNPQMISRFLTRDEDRKQFVSNYYCTSVTCLNEDLTKSDILSILNQRKDKLDMNSLINLNNTQFRDHPLLIDSLSH